MTAPHKPDDDATVVWEQADAFSKPVCRKAVAFGQALTVEAWVEADGYRSESMHSLVSQWSREERMERFDAYDAGQTDGMTTRGFFGAVFDGRYVYFAPQHDGATRHGKVLRLDTHGAFHSPDSWHGYDAGNTGGLSTKGYYGAVHDGRYVYFIPRMGTDGAHNRFLRLDTHGEFNAPESWSAHDVGGKVSYQSAAFDGRYIYLVPGYDGTPSDPTSGRVLRYDTWSGFADPASYVIYDASRTDGLETRCYDGAVFDGRHVYFAPLDNVGMMLRYDTDGGFTDSRSWSAFDAREITGLRMGQCVGATFDGRYVYYVPYANSIPVRCDTHGEFRDKHSWQAYNAERTSGLLAKGYDGAVFDGRYVYFIPFWQGRGTREGFHGVFLRYDTRGDFMSDLAWQAADASATSGMKTVGYNAGAFDGRFLYCAPWREGTDSEGRILSHGRVLRYDTTGTRATFSLRSMEFGHNGGLNAALPGPAFLVNTEHGAISVRADGPLRPGRHHLAGIYDGSRIMLTIDGRPAAIRRASGRIQNCDEPIELGKPEAGKRIFGARVLSTARSATWRAATCR